MLDTRDYTEIENEDFEVVGYECLTCGMTHTEESEAELCCMSDEEILGIDEDEEED